MQVAVSVKTKSLEDVAEIPRKPVGSAQCGVPLQA